jgi:hypothetical protein
MRSFKWLTDNEKRDFLVFCCTSRNLYLPVKSEREVLLAMASVVNQDPPDAIPQEAKPLDFETDDLKEIINIKGGDTGDKDWDPSAMRDRSQAILGYDVMGEWGCGITNADHKRLAAVE